MSRPVSGFMQSSRIARVMMTVPEVACHLKVDQATVYRLVKKGKLQGIRIGKVWRFNPESVERFARSYKRYGKKFTVTN